MCTHFSPWEICHPPLSIPLVPDLLTAVSSYPWICPFLCMPRPRACSSFLLASLHSFLNILPSTNNLAQQPVQSLASVSEAHVGARLPFHENHSGTLGCHRHFILVFKDLEDTDLRFFLFCFVFPSVLGFTKLFTLVPFTAQFSHTCNSSPDRWWRYLQPFYPTVLLWVRHQCCFPNQCRHMHIACYKAQPLQSYKACWVDYC